MKNLYRIVFPKYSDSGKEMKLKKLSLSFCDEQHELEKDFQDDYFDNHLNLFRVCHFFAVFFYSFFSILDYIIFPEDFLFLAFIRFGVIIPVFVIGFIFTFNKSYRSFWPLINNLYIIISGSGFLVMIVHCPHPLNYTYYVGIIICFIFGYTFIRSRFLMATIAGLTLLLSFIIVSVAIHTPAPILTLNLFFMVSINILGMLICYAAEISSRKEFFLRTLLKQEREGIQNTNVMLEKLVKERTKNLLESNRLLKEEIEERKSIESRLVQAQKMEAIGNLAGGIAHDFNNILTPMMGHAELLLSKLPKDSPLKTNLNKIYAGGARAGALVRQILTFSRQGNDEVRPMKIQHIISEAMRLIRASIPSTITINQDISTECGPIKADPTQIHQIVMNLATNAYHAIGNSSGTLSVNLTEIPIDKDLGPDLPAGLYACLSVQDSGCGIEPDIIEKIFDPFFTTKTLGKGTGLGLSVVHGIVKKSNGAVQVFSEPGNGTKFQIFLPVIDEKHPTEEVDIDHDSIQSGTGHILFVDDEEEIVEVTKVWLEHLGYTVSPFTSSLDALETFNANPTKFDLVITDLAMPDMSGNELSAELTKTRPDIPILLCTGFDEQQLKEKADPDCFNDYLVKPVAIHTLSKKINNLLGSSSQPKKQSK